MDGALGRNGQEREDDGENNKENGQSGEEALEGQGTKMFKHIVCS